MGRIETLVDAMTLEEQVSLLSGADFWSLPGISRLGLGVLRVTDGPNGARGGGSLIGGVKSAAFPVGIALGATWNVELLHDVGSALADEVKSKGAHVSLAPTVNLHRSVTNGRNFECYSEDPLLTAELAVAYIRGLQEKGISATIKHFAGNESEIERTTMNSVVDERALRELYLLPFEYAVKVAGTWGVMSSYNRLNGPYTSESHWLLTEVLRHDWGYDGVVMSDWFGSHSTAPTVNAGLDLEMPGPTRDRGEKLVAAVEHGEVSRDTLRTRVLNILRLMERTGALDDDRPHVERADDRPEHRALIRRAGAESMVLLKNDDGLLPLSRPGKVALIGPNARVAQIMGGGSAQLNPHYRVSPLDGLVAAFGADRVIVADGCSNARFQPLIRGRFEVTYFAEPGLEGEPVHRESIEDGQAFWIGRVAEGKVNPVRFSARMVGRFAAEVSGLHRAGLYSAGRSRMFIDGKLVVDAWTNWTRGRTFFEEGCDEVVADITLAAGESHDIVIEFSIEEPALLGLAAVTAGLGPVLGDAAIAEAVAAARAADTAIVCIGRNAEWDTEGSDLVDITLPGRQNELVEAVLAANPRTIILLQTGGPVEMPWIDRAPAVLQAWYPGQEAGNAIADVLLGKAEPSGRLPQSFPRHHRDNPAHSQDREVYPGLNGKVRYEEGVFIGYRHYDRHGIAPLFPFGFGLGYTTFQLSDLAIDADRFELDGSLSVAVTVRNTGPRAGAEVVQIYVGDPEASVARPEKELKAFRKVTLVPGESRTISFSLPARAFAFFDVHSGHWVVETGRFIIRAARHAGDTGLCGEVWRKTRLTLAR